MKKIKIIILLVLIILGLGIYFGLNTQRGRVWKYELRKWHDQKTFEPEIPQDLEINQPEVNQVESIIETDIPNFDLEIDEEKVENQQTEELTVAEGSKVLPTEFKLEMTFVSQAPHGNWDLPYKEACEEASAIMVAKYLRDEKLNVEIMDEEILRLVDWQVEKFGYYEHTDAKEFAQIMTDYFGLEAEIVENPTIDELKSLLYQGYPIIVPSAGRNLGNPSFTPPGPVYHMLVLIGWQGSRFITNDPGTRRGESFSYPMEIFVEAIHDFPHRGQQEITQEEMITGRRRVIVIRDY